jgi:hypothetical protein
MLYFATVKFWDQAGTASATAANSGSAMDERRIMGILEEWLGR